MLARLGKGWWSRRMLCCDAQIQPLWGSEFEWSLVRTDEKRKRKVRVAAFCPSITDFTQILVIICREVLFVRAVQETCLELLNVPNVDKLVENRSNVTRCLRISIGWKAFLWFQCYASLVAEPKESAAIRWTVPREWTLVRAFFAKQFCIGWGSRYEQDKLALAPLQCTARGSWKYLVDGYLPFLAACHACFTNWYS